MENRRFPLAQRAGGFHRGGAGGLRRSVSDVGRSIQLVIVIWYVYINNFMKGGRVLLGLVKVEIGDEVIHGGEISKKKLGDLF